MTPPALTLRQLPAQAITPEGFAPFGQVIFPTPDGKLFDAQDAQLKLDGGIPRFYLMQLTGKGRRFHAITRHRQCTQCLGAIAGLPWFIAVAPPGAAEEPDPETIQAFRISGQCFIKLHGGTWHAGPLFDPPEMTFYNLELSDTNLTDHQTCNLQAHDRLEFEVI